MDARQNSNLFLNLLKSFCMALFGSRKAVGIAGLGFLVFFLSISAPSSNASEKQAQTLQELISRYDTSRCKECHEEIHDQWEKSHHARSIMGIFMDRYLTKGVLSVKNPKEATRKNFPCFKCHFPQMEHASDRVASEIAEAILNKDKKTMKKLNISCLVCHHDKGIVHGLPKAGMLYGPADVKEHPDDHYKLVRKSPIMKRSVMCGQCHGLGPNLEFEHPVQCATLYGSYLHAYIPSGGAKTCQECHMENADHVCPPNFEDRKDVSRRLAQALTLDVGTLSYSSQITPRKFVPTVVVNVRITSKAGHRIPDG
ncbi:MAG: cytochrome c family protein [Deltaproteobacteria bacterium]|nr:cytochrome c family protein [Deltaproteobacteria bacterium]